VLLCWSRCGSRIRPGSPSHQARQDTTSVGEEALGLFAAIVDRYGAVELTENRRQHDPLERHVLQRLRDGGGREYLAHAQRTERLVEADDPMATLLSCSPTGGSTPRSTPPTTS